MMVCSLGVLWMGICTCWELLIRSCLARRLADGPLYPWKMLCRSALRQPARSVFEALTNTDIDASKIHCFLFPNVFNSLRHYRVRIIKPIPSFLWFGKYQIFLIINPKYQLVINATTPVILAAPAQIRSASTVTNLATNPVNVLCQPYAAFAKKKGTWVSIVIIPGSSRQLLQRMN